MRDRHSTPLFRELIFSISNSHRDRKCMRNLSDQRNNNDLSNANRSQLKISPNNNNNNNAKKNGMGHMVGASGQRDDWLAVDFRLLRATHHDRSAQRLQSTLSSMRTHSKTNKQKNRVPSERVLIVLLQRTHEQSLKPRVLTERLRFTSARK